MDARKKKWISRLVKFAFCAAALWYLSDKVALNDYVRLAQNPGTRHVLLGEAGDTLEIRDADTGHVRTVSRFELASQQDLAKDERPIELGLKTIVRTADWAWATWALLAFAPVTFMIGWRLRCLLATQDIDLRYRDALLLTLAGNFFNFAMPGTTGGDIYKAYHIAKRTRKRTEGITVVLLDRVIGLISFLLIAVAAIAVARMLGSDIIGFYGAWVGRLMIALVLGGMLFFSNRLRRLFSYEKLLNRLPFADKLRRIDETAFSLRYHPRPMAASLLVTLIGHGFIVTYIYFLARGLAIEPNHGRTAGELYLAILIATVVGYLFAAIPISIQGFGLLEAVFLKVLVEGGWSNASQMLALTLGARLVQILWSLPGVIVPWLGLERPPGANPLPPESHPASAAT